MRAFTILLAATIGAPLASLGAQEQQSSGGRAGRNAPACDGKVVSGIDIVREEPRLIGRSAPRFTRPLLRFILRHTLTKESAVQPFLLVEPGDECSEFRLAESG